MSYEVKCWECGRSVEDPFLNTCPVCGGVLDVRMDMEPLKELEPADLRKRPIGVWRYREFLPVSGSVVTLKEGGTPLYPCNILSDKFGVRSMHVKFEGANPTGSFKDRGMTMGVTKAVEIGAKAVGCASTGNTSASLSAYAAKSGLPCVILLPDGYVAAGKLAQAIFYGARIFQVDGNFDDALRIVRELSEEGYLYLLNSINPFRPEGQKTLAFEILDQLDYKVPDRVILPVGNAANIWSAYKGFREMMELGWIDRIPMMTGIQAEGSAPIVHAFDRGDRDFVPVEDPETVATAIRIGNPVSGKKALHAIYESGGTAITLTDDEILEAQRLLGRTEGVGVEPASAASVGGLRKLIDMGNADRDEMVVRVCTGHVLKDPDIIIQSCDAPVKCPADTEAVKRFLV